MVPICIKSFESLSIWSEKKIEVIFIGKEKNEES